MKREAKIKMQSKWSIVIYIDTLVLRNLSLMRHQRNDKGVTSYTINFHSIRMRKFHSRKI